MNCEQELPDLAAHAVGALDPAEEVRVDRHVRACPACATEVDGIRTTLAAVRRLPVEETLGDWSGRLPELREAAVRAALAEIPRTNSS
ncbi:zf-HC2 domain-containing protein [Streptomyces sp. MBT65]|uniref:anti-sigma factor family protein n=1 Tax=Streptomyces sp. MBT65 TaxID=1488395 RepID=UPI00190A9AA1|nr:zf-HC2 domain-containing protein [Streptomyces sp. MBT65]MBK3575899.1 zf-HC2 domain-containing protein [Streptomyces sp. MBT65]